MAKNETGSLVAHRKSAILALGQMHRIFSTQSGARGSSYLLFLFFGISEMATCLLDFPRTKKRGCCGGPSLFPQKGFFLDKEGPFVAFGGLTEVGVSARI